MLMEFRKEDLIKLPKSKKKSSDKIKLDSTGLYFPSSVTKHLGFRYGDTVDLYLAPNGKAFVIDRTGDDFTFAKNGSNTKALRINGMEMSAFLKQRFDSNQFRYEIHGELIYCFQPRRV